MVQLMSADLEVPLFAIERVGGVVVKSADSFDDGIGATHRSCEPYGVSTGDVRPAFVKAALVEKHDSELLDVMFLNITRAGRAASSQQRESCAGKEHHGPQPGP